MHEETTVREEDRLPGDKAGRIVVRTAGRPGRNPVERRLLRYHREIAGRRRDTLSCTHLPPSEDPNLGGLSR